MPALLDLLAPGLARAAGPMWRAVVTPAAYRLWLATTHDLTRATTGLLEEAAERSACLGEAGLAAWFAGQLDEERGHGSWVAADYAAAGGDPGTLAERVPCPATARLVGAQHYYLRHAHPVALLGHIALLERHRPGRTLAAALARQTGLPPGAFRTLTGHVAPPAGRRAALEALLARPPAGERGRRVLTAGALATAEGLVELFSALRTELEASP
ncbi:hypothetical protein D7294_09670 [Streptomyces hoynatensis]|uniref:Heme oxygenase n=1 Tax=Streptomyces hoynatensis TaxID=1141874 RepID=A0A3A9Z7X0_9ACTN|nr:hypothetical protein D7294_09670 [Streptomyces hoynatensis]